MSKEVVQSEWTADQLDLITKSIAKDATPNELKLFLYRCKHMGLDPLKSGQVHFVKYGSAPGAIVVGVEGFRSLAARTGKLTGIKRGAIRNDKGVLTGAWAEVYRSDWRECAREEVPLAEYDTGKGPWARMKETMIKKVAECAALRMAFPDDLGGVYERSEMDHAEEASQRVAPQQPEPEDGNSEPHPDKIMRGKWAGYMLSEIALEDMRSYVAYFDDSVSKGKNIPDWLPPIIEKMADYIGQLENQMCLE